MLPHAPGPTTGYDWVIRIRNQGDSALKDLYSLYRNECIDWLQKHYDLNEDNAKDTFQVSIVLLYENVIHGKIDGLSSSIKSYLFGIAKNKARDLIKSEVRLSKNKKHALIRYELLKDAEDKEKNEVMIEKVRSTLSEMTDPCKTILELFYFKRMKLQDIAPVVGHRHVNTTKSKKHKCLKKLQKLVDNYKAQWID